MNHSSDEQQIRDLVATWMSATRSGDVDTVLSLMTDDVVFLVAGQAPFGKQRFAQALKAPAAASMPKIEGHSEIQEIRIVGDWAFMWTRLSVEMTPPGAAAPVKRAGHTLSVLQKSDGRWRLARDANLLTPVDV
jgi:uncharacterized protein (TIGR02246 family)